ncbi:MAG TPA: hypothetical protein VLI06_18410 [Solimonas sp.]|nr:hypothetical protein [Solimonas sp.]
MKKLARFTPLLFALALSACDKAANEGGDDFSGGPGSKAVTVFDPVAAGGSLAFPFPIDLLFAGFTDPTLNIPNASNQSPVTAANELDGWSTTASLFTDLTGFVDYASVPAGLVIYDTSTSPPTRLVAGTDFTVQPSTAIDGTAPNLPINQKRSRILIEPLKPLKSSTTYVVALTDAVRSLGGEPIVAGDLFRVVRSATPVSQQSEPALTLLSETQKATLEAIRQQLQPAMQLLAATGTPAEKVQIAWPFTTQSATVTLQGLAAAAAARPLTLFPSGRDTSQLGLPLPPVADVYAGQLALPYYSGAPSAEAPTAPLTQFWKADTSKPNLSGRFLGQVPCAAFAGGAPLPAGTARPSASTTVCFPLPLQQSVQTVPVLVTIPKGPMPENGWPVVIFQHGITGNRSQMLPLAPALTQAGFAVIAIDLPLHGIPASDRAAALRVPGTTERSFELDLVNNASSAPGPDGSVDASGTHFINLGSLLTSRDNLRQGVSDLLHLGKSLAPRDGSGNGAVFVIPPGVEGAGTVLPIRFDTTQVRYVGHSLGAIVAGTFLGVNSATGAGVLAMPGGGIARLLDASASFGPRIAAGLRGNGVIEGSDNYETFLRFAQTAVDSGDPLNFATAARAGHPLLMIEVVGDAVVPNCAILGDPLCPATDTLPLSGYLSGTTPLARAMGLDFQPGDNAAFDVPVATPSVLLDAAARHNVVRFAQGDHGSILDPTASPAATAEMQRLTASFLRSDGLCLPIGGACPPAGDNE